MTNVVHLVKIKDEYVAGCNIESGYKFSKNKHDAIPYPDPYFAMHVLIENGGFGILEAVDSKDFDCVFTSLTIGGAQQ